MIERGWCRQPAMLTWTLMAATVAGCSAGLVGGTRAAYKTYTDTATLTDTTTLMATAEPRPKDGKATGPPLDSAVDDYLKAALSRNPALHRARRQAQAAGYIIAQVTSLADPILTVVPPTDDLTQTAAGRVDGAVGISQKIPFPAKLYVRGQVASHEAAASYERYRAVLLQTVADVQRAYYMMYFSDRSIEITERSRDLLRDFRNIAVRKYEAGVVPQQDVLRAQVELANLENELITLKRIRQTAQARLNKLMSYRVASPLPITRPIKPQRIEVALQELLDAADRLNPDIAAARERIKKATASVKLAKLEYVPDLTVGYTETAISQSGALSPVATGEDNRQLTFGISLPIWFERLSAAHKQAVADLDATRNALTDTQDSTAFRIEEAMLKVDTEQRLVDLFGGVIIPEARQTLAATVSAYRAGQVDFLTFVENWRLLLDFEISYQKSLSSFEQELAELERLIGKPLAGANQAS